MKTIYNILISGLVLLSLSACSQKFTIRATIKGLEETLYLIDENGETLETISPEDGSFTYKGTYEVPTYYTLADSEDEEEQDFYAFMFIEPGTISISVDTLNGHTVYTVGGTPTNDAYQKMLTDGGHYFIELEDPETTEERQEEIFDEYSEFTSGVYEENRDNYLGVFLLYDKSVYLPEDELLEELNSFPEELQDSKMVVEMRQYAEQKLRTAVGASYIEVAQNDADGIEITLSSVIGNPANRYVLLDFWASWCVPCMAEAPYLVAAYTKYHSKGFEIYGVSLDTQRENWLGAVKDNGLGWIQVCALGTRNNQALTDYAVQAIPVNFLIETSTGTIIAKNLRGEEVLQKISELLD